ncbi:LysM domain-containing protein [Apibacter sp. HY039]|uniref:LysM peptidoglycan-binding domain-containing protein n=1 Tax=Apibacter sp. HY039 TaxID=2501476 RepID=UPI000FEB8EDE|nr:LysM domain-containing protein [Apibacter sp. HY039]
MNQEYKIHIVESEEKLSTIASKYNTTPREIKVHNPELKTFGGFIGGEFVSVGQKIRIPIAELVKSVSEIEDNYFTNLEFEKKARYRCEQFNITRVNEETITLSSETRNQYLYSLSKNEPAIMQIVLEDSNFSVEPAYFKEGFEFARKIEDVKKNLILKQNTRGEISDVVNIKELDTKWNFFKDKELSVDPLYKNLKDKAPEQARDIISTGDKEFSSQQNLGKTLGKNLFFHILLRANVGEELEDYTLTQYSQLFPNLELTTHVVKSKVKEEEGITTYRLVGSLDRTYLSEEELKQRYDELYKPMIKYNYTEFNYIYRITYSINADNLLLQAQGSLCEKIKNNFEVITEYTIRKMEL